MNRRILRELVLKAGPPNQEPLRFTPAALTVFVGPNNTGKSLLLKEIEWLVHGSKPIRRVLEGLDFELPTKEEAEQFIAERQYKEEGGTFVAGFPPNGRPEPKFHAEDAFLSLTKYGTNADDLRAILGRTSLVRLDGAARLELVSQRAAGDLQGLPQSHLGALFANDSLRSRFRELIHQAFGLYPVIDATLIGQLRLRMSQRRPADGAEERNWDARAVDFHGAAHPIEDMSDGVKAYIGVVMTLLVGLTYRVVLIDEPEAFLHPPLARRLGRVVTHLASERHANVLAATHSPEFLFGIVQSGIDCQVVRMTYSAYEGATARIMPPDVLRQWMRDPMLRSTGVMGALFHRSVVVCEGDSDRPFYQEVNDRLTKLSRGAEDTLFLSGYGKQNARRIIRPLREIGIPAAAIVDLDVIKHGELTELMRAALAPDAVVAGIGATKGRIAEAFRAVATGAPSDRVGLDRLQPEDQLAGRHLIRDCAEYGVFIVPGGGVESWLSHLGVSGKGFEWLAAMFEQMGQAPDESNYVAPGGSDVWSFIQGVADWLTNPARLGVR